MKKFFENIYFDHALKTVIALCLAWFIYIQIDIRDFMTYTQPETDREQNEGLITISEQMNECREEVNYKNNNVNLRVDKHQEKIQGMDRKLDLILFKLNVISDKDLLTKTE